MRSTSVLCTTSSQGDAVGKINTKSNLTLKHSDTKARAGYFFLLVTSITATINVAKLIINVSA